MGWTQIIPGPGCASVFFEPDVGGETRVSRSEYRHGDGDGEKRECNGAEDGTAALAGSALAHFHAGHASLLHHGVVNPRETNKVNSAYLEVERNGPVCGAIVELLQGEVHEGRKAVR